MSLTRIACRALIRQSTAQTAQRLVMPAASSVAINQNYGSLPGHAQQTHLSQAVTSSRQYSKRAYKKKKSYSDSDSDSDSDRERRRKGSDKKGSRGQTSFWRRKMRTHHMVFDINNDGVVSWDDFEVLISRFTDLGNLSQDQANTFREEMKLAWEEEWGASSDPFAFIGQEQFMSNMETVVNTKNLRKKVARPLSYFFKAVDRDGSGEISIEEFKLFYKGLGLSEEAAMETFASIDVNNDGLLSIKEFCKMGKDFFLSEDENRPSKMFWGPLANDH